MTIRRILASEKYKFSTKGKTYFQCISTVNLSVCRWMQFQQLWRHFGFNSAFDLWIPGHERIMTLLPFQQLREILLALFFCDYHGIRSISDWVNPSCMFHSAYCQRFLNSHCDVRHPFLFPSFLKYVIDFGLCDRK